MHSPQPDLKMREGTVPSEQLYYNREDYPADMDSFNPFMTPAYECAKDEETYPEQVKDDYDVRGYFVKHILSKRQT
jgi:hypothetical protein